MKRTKSDAHRSSATKAKPKGRNESARAPTKKQTAASASADAKPAKSPAESKRERARMKTGASAKPKSPARAKRPKVTEETRPALAGDERPKGPALYDRDAIVDAPEHHGRAQAFGTLTWTTWDADPRPVGLRVDDFVAAFPPDEPHRFVGGSRVRDEQGTFQPGDAASRAARFLATDGRTGSLHELLARYGLRMRDAPPLVERTFTPGEFRDTARRRNHKLRVLHGGVDIESGNMDEKKAAYLDSQEKRDAAQQVREARRKMREDTDVTAPTTEE